MPERCSRISWNHADPVEPKRFAGVEYRDISGAHCGPIPPGWPGELKWRPKIRSVTTRTCFGKRPGNLKAETLNSGTRPKWSWTRKAAAPTRRPNDKSPAAQGEHEQKAGN